MTSQVAGNVPRPMCHPIEIISLSEFQKHQGKTFRLAPPNRVWIAAARQAAREAGVRPSLVLGDCRSRNACRARWVAWKRILDGNPRYSIAGLARVAGWDHSSILYAMRRLAGELPPSARRASGRRPKASIVT